MNRKTKFQKNSWSQSFLIYYLPIGFAEVLSGKEKLQPTTYFRHR